MRATQIFFVPDRPGRSHAKHEKSARNDGVSRQILMLWEFFSYGRSDHPGPHPKILVSVFFVSKKFRQQKFRFEKNFGPYVFALKNF